ncbi:sugar ABC transporter ATP-binding protein [Rhodobacteraceae bacterium CCMM004]|nr:sugar ABC transporter ATP-binding protein [Rhodobacteraceae bacterium CCMM004]
MLSARRISKIYGTTCVLDAVSVDFHPGEVVAIVGENGAGKSTLLKVLAAIEPRSGGEAMLDDRAYAPRTQREAERLGVALVFQELNVNRAVSVAENVMLGHLGDYGRLGFLNWTRLRADAQAILDRIGADFSATDDIAGLDLGQIKTIEVARALATQPRFVFFDESTAFLNHDEARRLMGVIRELRSQGIGVAFVSHHLQQVFEIADRLVVLKDGALVGTYAAGELTEDRLYELMVGRDLAGGLFPPKRGEQGGDTVLSVSGLTTQGGVGPLAFDLRRGEIVGFGGLKGSGGEAILGAVGGSVKRSAGDIRLRGTPFRPKSPQDAWQAGIAALPGDRTGEGIITEFSVLENLTLAARPRRARAFSDRRRMRAMADAQVGSLGIKTQTLDTPVGSLSGGNMQKVVLGKCLAAEPQILLLNNPTRGVDVGAKSEIYRVIRALADKGMAVLMVTEDLPELLALSDRVMVTRKGTISQSFEAGADLDEEEVVKWMM